MALAMEQDVATDPVDVGLLSAVAVLLVAEDFADLVEEAEA